MEKLMFPDAPARFEKEDLDGLLVWASQNNISDITFRSEECVFAKHFGRRMRVTARRLTSPEVGGIVNTIYGDNGTAQLSAGRDVDTAYSVQENRDTTHRFRFNATAVQVNGVNGYCIVLRSIPSMPPSLEAIDFPMQLLGPMSMNQGMVLITGETGSGKSTLQAALLRYRLEQDDANLHVLTYEQPIEFVYDDVVKPSSMVNQSEVPRHIPSFEAGIRNAMRRDPDIILIGESRDRMTMEASIEASRSGHLLMTTMHSNGVPSTIRRAVGMFPEGERNVRAMDIIESTQVILTQRLLRTVDGKRKAVREFLVFDDQIRNTLLSTPVDNLSYITRKLTKQYGQTMADDAKNLYRDNLISKSELELVVARETHKDEDSKVAIEGASHIVPLGDRLEQN
ncbi:type IV pilus twitching motility protein PilT [Methylobacillus sp. Pita2]|uniref:type IV pilus twitching motility protein PilT n=1 Tax=Methylobacillus sp. Pita2 TaxID=3383245 RepID=UPI0038B4A9A4